MSRLVRGRRRVGRGTLGLLVAAMVVLPVIGLASETAGADFVPNTSLTGAQNLALCFQQYKKLAVELLIDQTASLQYGDNGIAGHGPGTDPTGKRVVLAQSVVQALAQVQGIAGGSINVQAAGFGTGVDPVPTGGPNEWTPVTGSSASSISASLEQFGTRNTDVNTDYVTALTTANQNLQQERQAMGGMACTAIVLFTDGAFSLNPGAAPPWYGPVSASDANDPNSAVYAKGVKNLCEPNGIMDSLRNYDPPVFLFAAGLAPSPPAQGSPPDFSLLQGLALGSAVPGYSSCGTPNGTGAFFDGNVNQLASGIISGLVGGTQTPATCTASRCTASFVTYPYTKSASVYVTTNQPGQLSVSGPNGQSIPVPALSASTQVDGVTLTTSISNPWPGQTNPGYQWLVGLTGFPPPSGDHPATWTIGFTPGSTSTAPVMNWQANVVSGIHLVPESSGVQWKRGDAGDAYYRLVAGTTPISPAQIASADLTGTVTLNGVGASDPMTQVGESNRFQLQVPAIDPTTTATAASLLITGSATMKSGETVPVNLVPPDIPVVAPHGPQPASTLRFGLLQASLSKQRNPNGVQPVEPLASMGVLPVAAGPDGSGTICIQSTDNVTEAGKPVGVRTVGPSCRHLTKGQIVDVSFALLAGHPASGKLVGSITATTKWIHGTEKYSWTIPVTGTVVVPPGSPIVDQTTLWLLVIGSVLGAALLWFVMCWWTALLSRRTRNIQHYTVDAVLESNTLTFTNPSVEDFEFVELDSDRTRTARSLFLEMRAPIRLFRPQDLVVGQIGYVVTGTLGAARGARSRKGRIEHRIQGQWAFATPTSTAVAADADKVEGSLHYFVLEDASGTEARPGGLLDEIRKDVPLHLDIIRARASLLGPQNADQSLVSSDGEPAQASEDTSLW